MEKIFIIGLGYIGFPLACLLSKKKKVFCIDSDQKKINGLKKKIIPFQEKNLGKIFLKNYKNFNFDNKYIRSKDKAVFIICVPTPLEKNKANLTFLKRVFKKLSNKVKRGDLIIIESTIPPGTTEMFYKKYSFKRKNIFMSYCPERAIPGNTINEMKYNVRIIGGINKESSYYAKKIYKIFAKKIIITNNLYAELSKLAENTYRLVNIVLADQINILCKKYNLVSKNLFHLTNYHPRVNYLKPGIGIGGHCIPIDPIFLNQDNNLKIIKTSMQINNEVTQDVSREILKKIKNKKMDKILFLGVTYKENVDDIRESPALKIIKKVKKKTKNLKIFDPFNSSMNNIKFRELNKIKFDLVIYLVNHTIFKKYKIKSKYKLDYRY
ncbi:nucleotide sugar dehydrogenase [Candidatus Pelagibacter sp.]|nr:nucleotide sugar dehydrogenase [Candidatus Pelagibacter sp.]